MTVKHLTLVVPVPAKCIRCSARTEGLCSARAPEQLDRLGQRAIRQQIRAGSCLTLEGDKASMHTSLVTGVVKLIKTLPDGRRQIVGLQFGPSAIMPPVEESPVSIEAATDLEICLVPAALVEELGEHSREVDLLVLQ